MKAALVTPHSCQLPLYPSTYLGYGAAILDQNYVLDIIDLNAEIYAKHRTSLKKVLNNIDDKKTVSDQNDFYPLYLETMLQAERAFEQVQWEDYQAVYITMPSWFVNITAASILKLSNFISDRAPETKVFFFGNSLGSWTDENNLKKNNVNIRHLNALLQADSISAPVDYDDLPTPQYRQGEQYIFNILPFRLKHGCIWAKCRFCSLAKGWNSGYKERSSRKVIQELEELDQKYNPRMYACNDNSINGSNLVEFCSFFKSLDKPWAGMARADLTESEIAALSKSGCKLIYFGLESGSNRILKKINKGVTSKQMSDFIKMLCDHDIIPAPSLFVGAPGETAEDFAKTQQFIVDHENFLDIINIYPFMVTPGAEFSNDTPKPNSHLPVIMLAKICADNGMKVCIEEQVAEYVFYRKVYPGGVNL